MKSKFYLSIILLSLLFSVCEKGEAQAPAWLWAKSMGGINDDRGTSIAIDASGNVYTTGYFSDTVDFDPGSGVFNLIADGNHDIFISKADSSGNFVWAKSIGGSGSSSAGANSIGVDDSGNVYITGSFSGTVDFDPGPGTYNLTTPSPMDLFISKLDSSGNFVWAKTTGAASVAGGNAIGIDNKGNVYTTGIFLGTVDFNPDTGVFNLTSADSSPGGEDIFILKLDNSGNFVWAKRMGDIYQDESFSIAFDAYDNVYTTGFFHGTVDFDPGIGTFNITALSGLNMGYGDIFISKLDSLGNFVWAKQMGGATGTGRGNSIALDSSGNIYSAGAYQGTFDFNPGIASFNLSSLPGCTDIYISKLDSLGNFKWAKKLGGISNGLAGYGACLAIDASNSVYTTGSFQGTFDFDPGTGTTNLTSSGGKGIFISKLDSLGNFVWAKSTGGSSDDAGNSIALDASGNVFITGYFQSPSLPFGTTTLSSTNNTNDIFITRLGTINTGIENLLNGNNISIFPNPVNDVLTISLNKPLPANTIITISDMQGRVVGEKNTNHTYDTHGSKSSVIPINVSALSQGVYLLRMDGVVQRFVKL